MRFRLLPLGVVLMLAGALSLAFTLGGTENARTAVPSSDVQAGETGPSADLSRAMPFLAGLLLAGGAGMVGIGMMSRRAQRERLPDQ